MWLLDYVTKNSFQKDDISCGDVTASSRGAVAVNSSLEHRDLPIVAPFGIAYNPPVGEKSVVVPLQGGRACVGVISPYKSLKPGELMLFSKGGASIVLKNDGTVLINGKVYE
ncbi:MAG: hypothetical protein E7513_05965 [Ruminococcaceae bacterium]|nr:hypothetical protein [Oscillospiraceae bacterium]